MWKTNSSHCNSLLIAALKSKANLSFKGPPVCSFTCMLLSPTATLSLIVLFYILFVCKCVLYSCHRVLTQLQLTNTPISKRGYYWSHYTSLCRWLWVLVILKNVFFWWRQNYFNKHWQNLPVSYTNKTRKYTARRAQTLHSLSTPHTVNSNKLSQPLHPPFSPHRVNSSKPSQTLIPQSCPHKLTAANNHSHYIHRPHLTQLTPTNHHKNYIHPKSLMVSKAYIMK